MKESGSSCIHLEDTPWLAFQHLLEYMYTGQLDKLQYQVCVEACCSAQLPCYMATVTHCITL